MKKLRSKGFTLIELLTVIAIIAILASMSFVGLSRVLEKAKLTKLDGTMGALHKSLVGYLSDHGSYPPAYGYIDFKQRQAQLKQNDPTQILVTDQEFYHLKPYLAYMNLHGVEEIHDNFSTSYDTNGDGALSLWEYSPAGIYNVATDRTEFQETTRFNGSNNANEVKEQFTKKSRPLIYIPVNLRQFKQARRYWAESGDYQARSWKPNDPNFGKYIQDLHFPPAKYDAFALVSVGPNENIFGVVPGFLSVPNPQDLYHINYLRAYFLATRDLNGTGLFDFDFFPRTKEGEGDLEYSFDSKAFPKPVPEPDGRILWNQLPDPQNKHNTGPIINKYE